MPLGSTIIVTKYAIKGPMKRAFPSTHFEVLSDVGSIIISNQKGPTQIVGIRNSTA
jgi:hypothetical protein